MKTENDKKWAENVLKKIVNKMMWVTPKTGDKIPYKTMDGTYDDRSDESIAWGGGDGINWWTNGFWGGILWQMYHQTKDDMFKNSAIRVEDKLDRCFEEFYGLHHDVGFMWMTSAVYDYKLTGNEVARKRALHAATILAGRFNLNGNFIRAWNENEQPEKNCTGWAIIDCMMNLSILYWASKETKDPRFAAIAKAHANTAQKVFIREDGSSNHIVEFDPNTGKVVKTYGGQGYENGSAWSRGQAWAVYGFTISYEHTKDMSYLETAEKVADYCCANIPESGLIPCDFCQPKEPVWEDSCGAVILASGLLQLAKHAQAKKAELYYEKALCILKAIVESRSDWTENSDAIVTNCTAAYHDKEHHFNMVYADYFFIEAIQKLQGNTIDLW
ncbi:unsaturated chondroitin disaccharide hydrolase [Lachnotalea glycerini]|uniref:Unsaturated chondroitin disaccharide hydrolase n=1 Tax=Lachnotalea glycerini TaxID=1763509 RepID=A0A318EQZ5_9FIRM|nr:glycoside hydrolase family 88 protein [Lachnotalea glycerini]PXV85052.1 unsaturated chondroitin disaccharide hydrolase [Lachnotalea glycerini]